MSADRAVALDLEGIRQRVAEMGSTTSQSQRDCRALLTECARLQAEVAQSRGVRRNGWVAAWLYDPACAELKVCPGCGDHALEGEADCTRCGAQPADDTTWRDVRAAYDSVRSR